ncbi:hypothetical protein GCM10022233_26490 [Streptomyces shaanxiensis]|uniref:Transposase DDE domain-containing protein n=1 Tax=Streptomyces shaanxiensis TaxID=653357 RepID=A0ABP7UVN0_9ACTN
MRKERPDPGAQLRFIDADGMQLTCFATNTAGEAIAALELRHRQRARAEDRIRATRATGLRNPPLHDAAQNQIWLEITQIALDLLAWIPMPALSGKARLREPRRLRLPLFSAAAQLVTTRPPPHPPPRRTLTLDRRDHRRPGPAPRPPEPRLASTFPSLRAERAHRSHGTRRPPDATSGRSTCPDSDITTNTHHKGPASKLTELHERVKTYT